MTTVIKPIQIPRKSLAKLSIAMEQLATVTVRDQQIVEEGKEPVKLHPKLVDRFQRFKFWSAHNSKVLKQAAQVEEAALYTPEELKKIEAYHIGRDSIQRAHAKRDGRGNVVVLQDDKGNQAFDIPKNKREKCEAALEMFNEAHREVGEITLRIQKKLEESITVMLVCCDFRDIPIVVNGSYTQLFNEILLNKPRLSWLFFWRRANAGK